MGLIIIVYQDTFCSYKQYYLAKDLLLTQILIYVVVISVIHSFCTYSSSRSPHNYGVYSADTPILPPESKITPGGGADVLNDKHNYWVAHQKEMNGSL